MFGDGSMRRDFTHVDDIVARHPRRPGARARRVSATTTSGRARRSSCERSSAAIGEAAGVEPRVEHAPVPLGDVDATFADIARARAELGWEPRIGLREGLDSVLSWVRRHPAA